MSNESGDSAAREIELRDELLELLYWLEGEGFEGSRTLEGMVRFLAEPEQDARAGLKALVDRGDVVLEPSTAEYRLTPAGRREAARRFAEEFAPLLRQGHGECNDPTCECHASPAAAAECHAARAQAGQAR